MKFKTLQHFVVQFLTCLLFVALGATYDFDGNGMLNGSAAPQGKYPSQVSLQFNNGLHFCGGSILNSDYVLTSAACIDGTSTSTFRVVSSVVNLTAGGQVHQVITIVRHEDFMDLTVAGERLNDIALVKVTPKFDLKKAVILPEPYDGIISGAVATVIGWGETSNPRGVGSDVLLEVNVTMVDNEECEHMYDSEEIIHPQLHVCAGNRWDGEGVCQGDSGGPLFVGGVQVGVASFTAFPCGTEPGVYTDVASHVDWIWRHAV